VFAQPHKGEPPATQQLHLVEPIGKTIPKHLHLLLAQVVGVLLLFLPLQLYLLQRLLPLRLQLLGTLALPRLVFRRGLVFEYLVFIARLFLLVFETGLLQLRLL
jgi:hypothetical protein